MGAAVLFDAADARHHAIAVHGPSRAFLGNVNVALKTWDGHIRRDEGEAVAMHADASGGELAAGAGRGILARSGLDDCAARRQPVEFGFDAGPRYALSRQFAQQLFQSRAPVRQLANVLQDQARL